MKTLLEPKEFVQYVKKAIEKMEQGKEVIETDEMGLEIKQDGETKFQLFLGNIYRNYVNSGNMDAVLDFLNAHMKVQKDMETMAERSWEEIKEITYPTIRGLGFGDDKGMLSEEITEDFGLVYAVDHENYVSFLTENEVKDKNMDLAEIKKAALEKLVKEGWVKEVEKMEDDGGTLYYFEYHDREYLYQFFMDEMVKKTIGNDFYIAIPTKTQAVVFVPNYEAHPMEAMQMIMTLHHMSLDIFMKSGYKVSPAIYHRHENNWKKMR